MEHRAQHQASQAVDHDALQFARSKISFDDAQLISSRAWARTYRLSKGEHAHYLKVVPPGKAPVLAPIARLAKRFENVIPHVVAFDAEHGWLLSSAHSGRGLRSDSPEELALVTAYAKLQADAAGRAELMRDLPQPDIAQLPDLLLAFLQPRESEDDVSSGVVGVDYFIGHDDAATFHRALTHRLALLRAHLAHTHTLPATVNHGDLRPPNAAITEASDCVIMDWDDAMIGPAGMSLHGMFGGCTVPTILLSDSPAAKAAAETPHGKLIHAYIDTLAASGYSDAASLKRALPGSMCAGMIQFMLNFAAFPGEENRDPVGNTLSGRLKDLLDLCDLLTARNPDSVLEYAQEHEANGLHGRAERLLSDLRLRRPEDAEVHVRLAALQHKRGKPQAAEQSYAKAIELKPQDAALHAGLGSVLAQQLKLAPAKRALKQALKLDPALAHARADLERANAIEGMRRDAALPERMPVLRYTPEDLGESLVRPEMLALGKQLFERYGTLQIDNAFPVETIARLHDEFMRRYAAYFREADHPDALYLGDKRYMLTVDLEEPFSDEQVVGAPMVLPIIRAILGEQCVLGAFTAVISLPGSNIQRLHKDHPPLFPDSEWHHTLPPFAIQITIPLVPLNEQTGTTRYYKGSHRVPSDECEALGAQDPVAPLGSCVIHDYRVAHRGLGNRSEQVRPILTLIFNRRWFRDFKNYGQQPPLRLTQSAYEQMPDDVQTLFALWEEERKHAAERTRLSAIIG
jgi:tetratricopeptide (TPR) repeat protein